MFPPGFLGTRGDLLMDIVVLSLAGILLILWYSYRLVLTGRYAAHRNVQTALGIFLIIVVAVFETDIRMAGGMAALSKGGRFDGTVLLSASMTIHLALSNITFIIWVVLIPLSWFKFPRPPAPSPFSRMHRLAGKIGMIGMILTGITGIELYIVGLAL